MDAVQELLDNFYAKYKRYPTMEEGERFLDLVKKLHTLSEGEIKKLRETVSTQYQDKIQHIRHK